MLVLGSTGSIGTNTLKIAKKFSLDVEGLSANQNVDLLNKQIKEFTPAFVSIRDKTLAHKVNHPRVFCGDDGILQMIETAKSHTVVNALVGFAGLKPTIKATSMKKRVALANKESLVVGGEFVDMDYITPIDSEHFGLWYLLNGRKVKKMVITASGGAFRDTKLKKIPTMRAIDALKHPNWSMGKKITVDSATMTNKLFELLEAKWLFDPKSIDAVIEKNSLVHALVEFKDGSTTAHLANANMQLPIAYALLGRVDKPILPHVDLIKMGKIEFASIDAKRYPIWEIKDKILSNPQLGVVINAANEVGVELFLKDKINILQLVKLTKKAFKKFENINPRDIKDVYNIDRDVREYCKKG